MNATEYRAFSMTDLGFAIEALSVTLANAMYNGAKISDDTFETAGTELFQAGAAKDKTAAFTALLRVTRAVYEADAMDDAIRLRMDTVAAEVNRL